MQKNTNPEGYAANLQAWQTALTRAALAAQLPTEQLFILQTSDDLLSALASPQYGRPSGLGAVIDDCVRQGKIIDLKDFAEAENSIYSRTWVPSPWAILRWSLRQAGLMNSGSYDMSGRLRNGSLVLVPALEDIAKQITSWQGKQNQALTDRIISREAFARELSSILKTPRAISVKDLDLLLQYLSRDRQLLSYNATTIKLNASSQSTPDPVTPEDVSIASLKQVISSLTTQVASLEATVATQQSRAASYVAQKNKISALAALRSKKRAEQALQQRTATLQQLEDVYTSIEQAADQITIVETLQSSAATLKALNKKVGDVDKVEDVIDELREQMGKTEEVGNVLQEPLKDDVVGEVEVDEEFEVMEREEREREEKMKEDEMRRRLEEAGKVPDTVVEKGKKDNDIEEELSKSVEKMERLKIGDRADGREPQQAH